MHTTPEPTFRHAAPGELAGDLMRVGPAPNASREAFVTVVNAALATGIVVLLQPPALGVAVVIAAIALVTVARWLVGLRRWSAR